MATNKYKCNTCSNEFLGDEYTFSCSSCGKDDLINVHEESLIEKVKYFFLENRLISILVLLIVASGLYMKINLCSETNCKEFILYFENKKDHILVYFICKEGEGKKRITFNDDTLLFARCNFKAFSEGSVPTNIKKGKIYPCSNGQITITWTLDDLNRNKNNKWSKNQSVASFEFKNGAIRNESSYCNEPLSLTVKNVGNCSIEVHSNYEELYPKNEVLISVTGKKGEYKTGLKWAFTKNDKNYDVWGIDPLSNDTIAPINGSTGRALGCNPLDKDKIISAAKKYGADPANRGLFFQFKKVIDGKGVVLVNGIKQDDLQDLANKLDNDYWNEEITYEAITTFSKNGESVTVNFKIK
ncbi:MAG: hypothetical protein COA49_03345 [Bacteroidetes bacterium]|nr:MAG: hypothetical protein COA49_03345 [Bacteroidota bacterium]